MSIEGQGHFFTIYFPGFVCFVLYLAKISGERLQDHLVLWFFLALCSERGLWVHGKTGVLTGARGLCFGADMGKKFYPCAPHFTI